MGIIWTGISKVFSWIWDKIWGGIKSKVGEAWEKHKWKCVFVGVILLICVCLIIYFKWIQPIVIRNKLQKAMLNRMQQPPPQPVYTQQQQQYQQPVYAPSQYQQPVYVQQQSNYAPPQYQQQGYNSYPTSEPYKQQGYNSYQQPPYAPPPVNNGYAPPPQY